MKWHCLSYGPPDTTPCDAHGITQASAERHTRKTKHATTTHEKTWVRERKAA